MSFSDITAMAIFRSIKYRRLHEIKQILALLNIEDRVIIKPKKRFG